jgi:hypothetical protein
MLAVVVGVRSCLLFGCVRAYFLILSVPSFAGLLMLKVPTDVVVVLAKIVDHSVNEDIKLAMEATQGAVLRCDVKR